METILGVAVGRCPVEALRVGLVVREEEFRKFPVGPLVKSHLVLPHHRVLRGEDAGFRDGDFRFLEALLADLSPGPCVPIPE